MKRTILMFIVTQNICISLLAQKNYTISGHVRDSITGEELIGATIVIKELAGTGACSNAYGFYSITIPAGDYTITARFMGYNSISEKISLRQNTRLDFILTEHATQLAEVTVTNKRKDETITSSQMGVEKITLKEIDKVPVIFGEKDILKTLQLRPGVKSAGDGNSGFFVRGGSMDQNLVLLDEATVYNPSHFLGFFSVFNADAIKDVTLYKGSQPAEYGGRLSSVLDVRMKDGNNKEIRVNGGIGLIASRLNVEGPIVKDKGSFIISARRTYADLFLKLSPKNSVNNAQIYFYDLNAKANYRLGRKDRIFLSGYLGKDELAPTNVFGFNYRNITGTLRWNHLFSDRLFSNTSLIFSNYDYNVDLNFSSAKSSIIARIQDYNLKQDFQYFPNLKNKLKYGFSSIYHKIIPGISTSGDNKEIRDLNATNKYAWENAVYISHEYKPKDQFSFEYGFRYSLFSILGPGDFYSYNSSGQVTDTISYRSGQFIKTYSFIEPRLSVDYVINEKSSLKAAYSRNTQYLHLLSNSTSASPTDLWIPSSNYVKPEIADQVSVGYFKNFKDNNYEFSAEVYYKFLQNQIDYKDGAKLTFNATENPLNENLESQLLFGKGRAYGIEFFLQKKYKRLTGWVSYTLSRTEKKIKGINNGEYYPARQDRTHDVSIVAMYELTKKWTLSSTFVYYSGNAVSFPSGKYYVAGQIVSYYTERNNYRMPAYNRLDLSATWQRKKTAKFESSWTFSLYNAYGRENAYTITFQEDPDNLEKTQAVQTSLFRWVPSVTYNFKF